MRISSDSFDHGKPIPADFALGAPGGFGGNRNPQLSWGDAPEGTRSFALTCVDLDVPSIGDDVNQAGRSVPATLARIEFVHWVMIDIPAEFRELAAGSCAEGVVARGKRDPVGPPGSRQGLNDYTGWFAGDAGMGGDWSGYDGPYPPAHDLREHRYFFRVFALDVARLELPERFAAGDVLRAIQGHVLAEAATWGSYSLHASQA